MRVIKKALSKLEVRDLRLILDALRSAGCQNIESTRALKDPDYNTLALSRTLHYMYANTFANVKAACKKDRFESEVIGEFPDWSADLEPFFPCAVEGCEEEGQSQQCPFDGAYHHHGRIHYDREKTYGSLTFKVDGWHLICDNHYKQLIEAIGK